MTQIYKPLEPLGLPRGSIRAVLALAVFGTAMVMLLKEQPLERDLWLVTTAVLGYYYASRDGAGPGVAAGEAKPLGLPRGSIRWLLFLGFAATAGYLIYSWQQAGKPLLEQEAIFPILAIGSFFVGRLIALISRGGADNKLVRGIGHAKGALALLAAMAIIVLHHGELDGDWVKQARQVVASFVFFYYGSR